MGYTLTLTRNKEEAVIDRSPVIADVRNKIDHMHWYILHYRPSIQQQGLLSKQILSRTSTEFRYFERYAFMKEVNIQNLWNFKMGSQESVNVLIWIIIGFQRRDRQDREYLKNDTIFRLPVTSDRCIIGTEKYPDAGILLNYHDDDCSQGFSQIKEAFRALTKDDILETYVSDDDFRSSNTRVNIVGCNLYVLDIRYEQKFTASQPVKEEFRFDGVVSNDINGYALLLTNNLVSVSSSGQRHFDLIYV